MKQLMLNDGRSMEVQNVSAAGGIMHVRMIMTTSEQLKAYFKDNFATSVMTLYENGKEQRKYENYTTLSCIKEEAGGIWEVEMRQDSADMNTRLEELEEEVQASRQTAIQTNTDLQIAIAELTALITTLTTPTADGGGGETDVS